MERRLHSGDEHVLIESHLAKYRSLVPSLALVLHLVDGATGPVSYSAVKRALGWAEYLESHARKVYAPGLYADIQGAHTLLGRIKNGKLASGFTVRDVQRKGWTGLTEGDVIRDALGVLVEANMLRPIEARPHRRGGRPSTSYELHPALQGGVAKKNS